MKKSPSARAQSLLSLAKGLESKRRDIAVSISIQAGLSVEEAEKEVDLSLARLSDWAAYCDKIRGGTLVRLFINKVNGLYSYSPFFSLIARSKSFTVKVTPLLSRTFLHTDRG